MNIQPELLAPAGDLEKLKIAINYGADAVYIGGKALGLRANARNFEIEQMAEGIDYAHKFGAKVYVTANIYAHNDDLDGMDSYFKTLKEIGADAVLVSDPGVFSIAREAAPDLEIHISTQANNTNYKTALFWHKLGAKRIVTARELSLKEILQIRNNTPDDFEIETFVHGAMCISYSGRCLLSSYLSGRSANKGECSHPCRWEYSLVEKTRPDQNYPVFEDERGTYIFNSKDLCMITDIGALIDAGVGSFKIEGRMKTPYYVAVTVKAYREAIDDYLTDKELYESKKDYYLSEVKKVSHRHFTTGFYYGNPKEDGQTYGTSGYIRHYDFIGVVLEYDDATGIAVIEQRNKFSVGDTVEFMRKSGQGFFSQTIEHIYDEKDNSVQDAPHPQQILKVKTSETVSAMDIMRKLR